MISSYVNYCYEKKKINEIKTMLEFLDNMSKTNNKDVLDLLLA
jgi:hypothetical protein